MDILPLYKCPPRPLSIVFTVNFEDGEYILSTYFNFLVTRVFVCPSLIASHAIMYHSDIGI